jgi:hypothetical protein
MDESNLPNFADFQEHDTVTRNIDLLYGCMNISLVHICQ